MKDMMRQNDGGESKLDIIKTALHFIYCFSSNDMFFLK